MLARSRAFTLLAVLLNAILTLASNAQAAVTSLLSGAAVMYAADSKLAAVAKVGAGLGPLTIPWEDAAPTLSAGAMAVPWTKE